MKGERDIGEGRREGGENGGEMREWRRKVNKY